MSILTRTIARLVPAAAAMALTVATADAAPPTTIGIEWEMVLESGVGQRVYFKERAFKVDRQGGIEHVLRRGSNANQRVDKRILCTAERSPVDGRYPLVTISYDLGAFRSYTLEVITGPIESTDTPSWNQVTDALSDFYSYLRTHCEETREGVCTISVARVLAELKGFQGPCGAARPLTDGEMANIDIEIPYGRGELQATIEGAGAQVSLGIDWARFGDPGEDLGALYDGFAEAPSTKPPWEGQGASLARQAFDYARARLLPKVGGNVSPEQRGFLVQYFIGLQIFHAYMHKLYAGSDAAQPYAAWLPGVKLEEQHWALKSFWSVLPKEPLPVTAKNVGIDPQVLALPEELCAADFAAGLALVEGTPELDALSEAFGRAASRDTRSFSLDDEDESSVGRLKAGGRALVDDCLATYAYWHGEIMAGRDPMALAAMASTIGSYDAGGKLRGVFEVRRVPHLIGQRALVADVASGGVTVQWKRALVLPGGLALPEDKATRTHPRETKEEDD